MGKEIKEWFKVIEIADMVGLSKVSVYNKIKTIDREILKGLQKKEKGITYFHIKAVDIIRAAFNQDDYTSADIEEVEPMDPIEKIGSIENNNEYAEKYIEELKSEIEFLKEQIKIKDDLIIKHVKLVENEQILRREEQRAIALLEETRSKELEEKISTWRREHFEEHDKESNFFKKIFKKKM